MSHLRRDTQTEQETKRLGKRRDTHSQTHPHTDTQTRRLTHRRAPTDAMLNLALSNATRQKTERPRHSPPKGTHGLSRPTSRRCRHSHTHRQTHPHTRFPLPVLSLLAACSAPVPMRDARVDTQHLTVTHSLKHAATDHIAPMTRTQRTQRAENREASQLEKSNTHPYSHQRPLNQSDLTLTPR